MRIKAVVWVVSAFLCWKAWGVDIRALRKYVEAIVINENPYVSENQFGERAEIELLTWLADSKMERHWGRIIRTLGFVGTKDSTKAVIRFFQEGNGRLGDQVHVAKTTALFALGYMANRGNQEALDYLLKSLDPRIWQSRKIMWQLPGYTLRGREIKLTSLAMLALGLSGRTEAASALSVFLNNPQYAGVAKIAIEANEKVQKLSTVTFWALFREL